MLTNIFGNSKEKSCFILKFGNGVEILYPTCKKTLDSEGKEMIDSIIQKILDISNKKDSLQEFETNEFINMVKVCPYEEIIQKACIVLTNTSMNLINSQIYILLKIIESGLKSKFFEDIELVTKETLENAIPIMYLRYFVHREFILHLIKLAIVKGIRLEKINEIIFNVARNSHKIINGSQLFWILCLLYIKTFKITIDDELRKLIANGIACKQIT
jgi:hypothetical protein